MRYNVVIGFSCFYIWRCFCLEKVYAQLKEKFAMDANVNELFTKQKIEQQQSISDIYRKIAFGEMPILHDVLQVEQH